MPNLPAFALNDLVASAGTFYSTSGLQVPLNFVTAPGNVQQAAPVESPVADLVEALINNGAESKLILAEFATSSNSDTSQPDPESPWDKVKNSLPTLDVAQAWKDLIAFLKKLGEKIINAMEAPVKKAIEFARDFYQEHPILVKGVVLFIIGVCICVVGFVPLVAAIGFGALGVIKGSLAALVQASYYGALIPAKCIFAILQSIGATATSPPLLLVMVAISLIGLMSWFLVHN